MKDSSQHEKMRFTRLGGAPQLEITSFEDLREVLALDDALWALNSISVDSLRADRRLLQYIDSDGNGRIRTDEVKNAIRFLLEHLSDGTGVTEKSDTLVFSHLNKENSDTPAILIAADKILESAGIAERESISLQQLESNPSLRENAGNRQDGIITTDDADTPESIALIKLICEYSGKSGIAREEIDAFQAGVKAFLAWKQEKIDFKEKLFPFGEKTSGIAASIAELKNALDDYFINSETLLFLDSDPDRPLKKELSADPLDAGSISQLLEKLSIAAPEKDASLNLDGAVNPLYREKLETLFGDSGVGLSGRKVTRSFWLELQNRIAPYQEWLSRQDPQSELLENIPDSTLNDYASGKGFEVLDSAIRTNSELSMLPDGIKALSKLLILQKWILDFLRNFVSLSELFIPGNVSLLQTGKLIMDSRHFSLITPVKDIAEHKRIVKDSNICIAYINVNRGTEASPVNQTMAVAITSGQMQRLFIGKRGIFYAPDMSEHDAKVIDFVEQPVSIMEALKSPFRRFGAMIATQTDKLFSSRNAKIQKELESDIAAGKLPQSGGASGNQGAMGGLPMLMMGGGIGIAAIGSAAAFIAKTLSNVSFWAILSVIVGIVLVFGGPSVVIALIKLYCRDLGRFLEAAGNAVNRPMRLSGKLGRVFTWAPPLPGKVEHRIGKKLIILLLIVLGIAAAVAGVFFYRCSRTNCCRKNSSMQVEETAQKHQEQTVAAPEASAQPESAPEAEKIKK